MTRAKGGYTYIMSNVHRTTLYIGVTSDLYTRVYQHKYEYGSAFTKKYNCVDLMYYEFHPDIETAIKREKRLKKYKRDWKWDLIDEMNPERRDLFDEVKDMR
ncbi:GIY-YIG nuclease family protein [Reichenbachiella ulvae]|uniref:GIY-YIG nuclease family protein n=1 Tax=Reichenbachiella ulvae TaxID=2980104 RepID=A0ABT3CYN0_9BACT|nr:GIY-YIG nuclease family protein [Reichenbachiella ulvae]MCV9388805.1 GIY-YIG nuclease family protein [Reichenbachiella ulvae]